MPRSRTVPARQPSLREHNLALVLAEVADRGPASRARIASATGLTKATVSTLVDALCGSGLLSELGPDGVVGVGRPGSALALGEAPAAIGLEINVDYVSTCTVDLRGRVRDRQVAPQDLRRLTSTEGLARAADVLRGSLGRARSLGVELAGVAVAVPGLVESRGRLVRVAPNLGWRDIPVLEELRERAGLGDLPLRMGNEANLAALGELWCGAHHRPDGAGLDTFVYVSGEIGVGAALVIDGALFGGTRGFSGEIGHLPLDPTGPPCTCGSHGCLEQFAGQEAILRRAGIDRPARTPSGRPDDAAGGDAVDELIDRAGAGEREVLWAIRDAGSALGVGIAVMVNLVDVDTVVLGGLYARLAPWMLDAVQTQIRRRALSAAWEPVRLLVGGLGADAAVRGAAMSVVRQVIDDPAAWMAGRGERPLAPPG